MQPIGLLLVDRRSLFRQALATLLRAEPGLLVVGEAQEITAALPFCAREPIDLFLLDTAFLRRTETTGRRALAALRQAAPNAGFLALGRAEQTHPAALATEQARVQRAGISVCLSPQSDQAALREALLAALPEARRKALAAVWRGHPLHIADAANHTFTEREREIVRLVAEGLCNKEIAYELGIHTQTVKNHVSHLLQKLALADRTQLAVYFLEHPA